MEEPEKSFDEIATSAIPNSGKKFCGRCGFYLDLWDNLGMVSGVLGHEEFIGNGPRWLGSMVFAQRTVDCFGRN